MRDSFFNITAQRREDQAVRVPARILEAHMQTKQKSNSVITHRVDGPVIVFSVIGVGEIELNTENLHTDVAARAAIHGMIQRISDAAAIPRDPETGKSATPQEKYDAMAALVAHYESGTAEWSRVGQGTGEPRGQLFRALCVVYPNRAQSEIREWLNGKSKAEQATMRATQKVRDAVATFTDSAAGDAILDELNE